MPAGLIVVFTLVLLGVLGFFGSRMLSKRESEVVSRLSQYTAAVASGVTLPEEAPKENIFDKIDKGIEKQGFFDKIQDNLTRAAVPLRVSEFIAIRAVMTFGLALVGFLFRGKVGLASFGLVGFFFLPLYVRRAEGARINKFNSQIEAMLSLTSNGLKSGYSFLQAVDMIAREMPPPMSVEFQKLIRETSLGMTVEDSMGKLASKIRSDDFDLVVTSVLISRQTGGNLSEVLDNIAFTIRERIRIKGEIQTLTAMATLSGWIVTGLPIALTVALFFMNPEYMEPLFKTTIGNILVGVGIFNIVIGRIVMKKMTQIEV